MSGNRVQPEHLELMKAIADQRLTSELSYLDDLFDRDIGDPESPKYVDSAAKRAADIRAEMGLIKDLCQWASGAVHPVGQNTKDEKKLASDLVASTRAKFEKAGILNEKN